MSAPDSRWVPGDRVMVISGSERGRVGTIKAPTEFAFDGCRCWRICFDDDDLRQPAIRDDFLAPAPTKSDEDVLGPLRNISLPE
jgi:transcription elongation factor